MGNSRMVYNCLYMKKQSKSKVSKTKKIPIIVANWKTNPVNISKAKDLVNSFAKNLKYEVIVCPPSVYSSLVIDFSKNKKIKFGLQNVSEFNEGAHTGEVGAKMAKSVGYTHSIIGHSERRKGGETSEMVSRKVFETVKSGLTPIVCIGEDVRDSEGGYLSTLKNQIYESLSSLTEKDFSKIIIAYEPVWAIGAEKPVIPQDLHETSLFIRKALSEKFGPKALKVRMLYGGSVFPENAKALIDGGEIDGFLLGRVSLDQKGFRKLIDILLA